MGCGSSPTPVIGDNGSVVTSSTQPHSPLKKRHHALAYHFVREAIAAGIISFHHLPGEINPADILTKPLAWHMLRIFVEPLLLWKGDTRANAPSDGPSSPNPEGSDAGPGLEHARDSNVRPTRGTTSANTNANTGDVNRQAGVSRFNALWNNQYAALVDDEED